MYEVIVVGGGVVGAASAYYLSQAGVKVLLCERAELASGASGQNAGIISLQARTPGAGLEVVQRSRTIYRTLEEELGSDIGFRPSGGLVYFLDECQRPFFESLANERREVGVEAVVIDRAELRQLAPLIAEEIPGGMYVVDDAQVDTPALVRAFADRAEQLGARVLRETEVRRITLSRGRVNGVATSAGPFMAESVVLAAGVASGQLCRSLGFDLPVQPLRGQLLATAPVKPGLIPHLGGPGVIRHYAHYSSLAGYEEATAVSDPRMASYEYAVQKSNGQFVLGCPLGAPEREGLPQPSLAGLSEILNTLPRTFPALKYAALDRAWAGLIPHTPDALPIVDWAPECKGLLIAAGHSNGNSSGPATGELVATLVTGSGAPEWLEQFAFDRPSLSLRDRFEMKMG